MPLAEADGFDDLVYITIGTGVGGGLLSGGRLVHGALHPEFGHWFFSSDETDMIVGGPFGSWGYEGDLARTDLPSS